MRKIVDWTPLDSLPPKLSLNEIAAKFPGVNKSSVMRKLKRIAYDYGDGRGENRAVDPKWQSADWSKKDGELASVMGVSRQRVAAVRKKVSMQATFNPDARPAPSPVPDVQTTPVPLDPEPDTDAEVQ